MSTTTHCYRVIAAVIALSASSAFAAEVPASFDAKNCKADYPKASLMNEEQGTVSMSFLVKADGSVADSKVDKSSGFKNLDKAAIKALSPASSSRAPRTARRPRPGPRSITPGSWTDRSPPAGSFELADRRPPTRVAARLPPTCQPRAACAGDLLP